MAGTGRTIAFVAVWAAASLCAVMLGAGLAAAFTCAPSCVTLDGSLPKDVPTANLGGATTGNITIPSGVGVLRSPNLFHSFGLFNVQTGGSVTFTRTNSTSQSLISNIIARVTGGQSTIDGLLAVQGGALGFSATTNLYLLNPAGVMFTGGARLNVPASFHVSSADYLRLGTVQFSSHAQPPGSGVPMSGFNAAPEAFGFLGNNPAAISVTQGSAVTSSLSVLATNTTATRVLSVVGGPILISTDVPGGVNPTASTIVAPGGRVQIVSVASAGEAVMTAGATPDINVDSFAALGRIDVRGVNATTGQATGRAVIDASGTANGTVLIRAGKLVMNNARIISDSNAATGAARAINIRVTGDMTLGHEIKPGIPGTKAEVLAGSFGSGEGGDIVATVGSLSLENGSNISRTSQGLAFGNTPTTGVTVNSAGPITIDGTNSGLFTGTTFSENLRGVTVTAPSLTMSNRGTISSIAQSDGVSGDISVTLTGALTAMTGATIFSNSSSLAPAAKISVVADSVSLSGRDPQNALNSSGILSGSRFEGPPGEIFLTVGSLSVTDGAKIESGSAFSSQGGSITVQATRPVLISNGGSITSQTSRQNVGPVKISAPALTIDNGLIKATTVDVGKAGDIAVTVDGTVNITHGGQIQSSSTSTDPLAGNAGKIVVTAPALTMSDGAKVSVTTQGPGAAGDIALNVHSVSLTSGARVDSSTTAAGHGGTVTIAARDSASFTGSGSGVFSTTDHGGNAGTIVMTTPALTLSGGAKVAVDTLGAGTAGDIALNVGSVGLTDGARIDSGTSGAGHGGQVAITAPASVSISSAAVSSNATAGGTGGNININTPQMELTNQATLSATSTGTGNAGNISLLIGNSLRLQDSAITTAATRADGGNISITTTGSQVFLSNGRITTSVQSGIGGGGNITLGTAAHPIEFLILNGSEIRADAFGGPGGNINIFAGTFLTSNSILSASSALGVPGTIGIQAGITNVSSVVGQLPESVLQAATLLRAACATRLAGGQSSSLVVSGREGLPAEPGGALPSPLVAEGPADSGLSLDEGGGHDDLSNRIALWVPAPRCLR